MTERLNTHTHIFLGKLAIQILGLFFNLVACFFLLLSFESSLYILGNSPLSYVSFANTFSKSVAYLLLLLRVTFAEQKFLIF